MARTFQNIRLFSELSVIDNVKVAYNMHVKYGLLEAVGRFGRYFNEEEQITEMAMDLLKIFHMEDKADELAKTCLTANSVVWKLPVRLPPSRNFCFWTNRQQG